jgi:hypothetical protein
MQMNPAIKQYRSTFRTLSRKINQSQLELKQLTKERDRVQLQLQKAGAQDCIDRCNKYVGKWIVGRGIRIGTHWYNCDFLIKPAAFILKEFPSIKRAAVAVVGSILWRNEKSIDGGRWRLHGKKDTDGKVMAQVIIFRDMRQNISFRLASKKELDTHKTIVAIAEKYAPADFTSLAT